MAIRRLIVALFSGAFVLSAPPCWGANGSTGSTITLLKEVVVYPEASEMSSPIGTFRRGARLLVAHKDRDGWRRVVFMQKGKRRGGWVLTEEIYSSMLAAGGVFKAKASPSGASSRYRDGQGIGGNLALSYMQQNERELALSDSVSVYQISKLTSLSFWFSVFYDQTLNEDWALRYSVGYRNVHLKGDAELAGVGGAPATTSSTEIVQSYLVGALTLKRYFKAQWWAGAGGEFGKNLSVSVKQNGQELPLSQEDRPYFMFLYGALGWEASIASQIYFVPEFKLGAVTSIDPMAYLAEAHFSFAYRW